MDPDHPLGARVVDHLYNSTGFESEAVTSGHVEAYCANLGAHETTRHLVSGCAFHPLNEHDLRRMIQTLHASFDEWASTEQPITAARVILLSNSEQALQLLKVLTFEMAGPLEQASLEDLYCAKEAEGLRNAFHAGKFRAIDSTVLTALMEVSKRHPISSAPRRPPRCLASAGLLGD